MTDFLEKALEPFERVASIIEPLNISDEKPLRDVIPGVWPTIGDLRRLLHAARTAGKSDD